MIQQDQWNIRIEAEYQAGNLTPHYRGVLLALFTFRGRDNRVFPSHDVLAQRTVAQGHVRSCCSKTAERALKQARKLELVWWLPQYRREGWRKLRASNLYVLNLPAGRVEPGRGPVWPRYPTDRQAVRVKGQEVSKKAALEGMIRDAASQPDLLAARRAAIEQRLRGFSPVRS